MTFQIIRKFILLTVHFIGVELRLFGAFEAPYDDIFYQSIDDDDWKMMNRNLIISELRDQRKYLKELRQTMNSIMVSGASVLKCKEEKSSLFQGLSLIGHSAVYNLLPENASEQFRYWIAKN